PPRALRGLPLGRPRCWARLETPRPSVSRFLGCGVGERLTDLAFASVKAFSLAHRFARACRRSFDSTSYPPGPYLPECIRLYVGSPWPCAGEPLGVTSLRGFLRRLGRLLFRGRP